MQCPGDTGSKLLILVHDLDFGVRSYSGLAAAMIILYQGSKLVDTVLQISD